MKVNGEKEVDNEKKIYATYAEWVDDEGKRVEFEIKTGHSEIEKLVAALATSDNRVEILSREVEELEGDIDRMETEQKESTALRDRERQQFREVDRDYSESVDAIGRALEVLQGQQYSRPQAMMLLQRMAVNSASMQRVVAKLSQADDGEETGAPKAAAYESQSEGISELLEKLEDEFKQGLNVANTEESSRQRNYEMQMVHLKGSLKNSNKRLSVKASAKGKAVAESAAATGELAKRRTELAANEQFLSELKATYEAKTQTYNANQKVRKEELAAVGKAVEVISAPQVEGSYSGSLVQSKSKSTSFLQLSSRARKEASTKRAAAYLKQRAQALSSKTLYSVYAKVVANPFAKVVQLLKDLISKLKAEAAEEADHKAWCDEQLRSNGEKRDRRSTQAATLSAEIESLTSERSELSAEIEELTKDQSALTKAMAEATTQREAEKTKNERVAADAAAAADAVKRAIAILEEFYAAQQEQPSLLQEQEVPEMKSYGGMTGAKSGVIGLLEVIDSDLVKMKAETMTDERMAASEYDSFMRDAKEDNEAKHQLEVETKLDLDTAEQDMSQSEDDLGDTNEELSKAKAYYEELKPQCVTILIDQEQRVSRRKAEIESLKEAYKILDEKS